MIKRGGHRIDPLLIEEALCRHPDVALAAAVGMPDAHAGELPVAYVQLRPGASATEEALVEFAAEHTPERAAVPRFVAVMRDLPKTPVGKVSKVPLRVNAARRVVEGALADLPGRDRLTTEITAAPTGLVVRLAGDAAVVALAKARLSPLPVAIETADGDGAGAGDGA